MPDTPEPGDAQQARRLEHVAEALTDLLRRPEVAQRLRAAPGQDEWSAMQIIGHMSEIIPYWLSHCQTIIAAEGEPPAFGRSLDAPERLAAVEHGASVDPEQALREFKQAAEAGAQAIRAMSSAERAKTGVHQRFGLITVADAIERLVVAHAEDHLKQIRAALGDTFQTTPESSPTHPPPP